MPEPTTPHLGDELVDLALGHVDARRRAQMSAHLLACPACRSEYETLSAAVADATSAVPAVQPPVGFDAAVLQRLAAEAPPTRARSRARARRRWWVAAAAAIVVLVGGAALAIRGGDDVPVSAVVPLRVVDGGRTVGTVSLSAPAGDPLLVVAVVDAPPEISYTCRMRMRDGSVVHSEPWPAVDRGAWIVDVPGSLDQLERVELVVTGTDHVWSAAKL